MRALACVRICSLCIAYFESLVCGDEIPKECLFALDFRLARNYCASITASASSCICTALQQNLQNDVRLSSSASAPAFVFDSVNASLLQAQLLCSAYTAKTDGVGSADWYAGVRQTCRSAFTPNLVVWGD